MELQKVTNSMCWCIALHDSGYIFTYTKYIVSHPVFYETWNVPLPAQTQILTDTLNIFLQNESQSALKRQVELARLCWYFYLMKLFQAQNNHLCSLGMKPSESEVVILSHFLMIKESHSAIMGGIAHSAILSLGGRCVCVGLCVCVWVFLVCLFLNVQPKSIVILSKNKLLPWGEHSIGRTKRK